MEAGAAPGASRPLRVLLVTGEYPPDEGGVADYTRCLGEALADRGVEVRVVTGRPSTGRSRAITGPPRSSGSVEITGSPSAPGTEPADSAAGRPTLPVDRVAGGWGWSVLGALSRHARRTGADVVHVQYQAAAYGMRPAIHLAPWWVRRRTRARTAVTFHDVRVPYLFPKAGRLRTAALRLLARGADLVVATNEEDAARVGSWRPEAPALVPIGSNVPDAPPGDYDRAAHRAAAGIPPGADLIAYFGFLNASKGGRVLVQALDDLVAAGRDARLVMLGGTVGASDPTNEGYLAALRREADARGLTSRLVWTGHLPPEQVSAWLRSADAAALPYEDGASYRRGSLLAALAHGVPVVTTVGPAASRGALPALVDGISARLVPPGDPTALAAALAEVLADRDLAGRLSAGAREVSATFAWPAIAARHVELYERLAAGRAESRG